MKSKVAHVSRFPAVQSRRRPDHGFTVPKYSYNTVARFAP
jgi:hypothetical protein